MKCVTALAYESPLQWGLWKRRSICLSVSHQKVADVNSSWYQFTMKSAHGLCYPTSTKISFWTKVSAPYKRAGICRIQCTATEAFLEIVVWCWARIFLKRNQLALLCGFNECVMQLNQGQIRILCDTYSALMEMRASDSFCPFPWTQNYLLLNVWVKYLSSPGFSLNLYPVQSIFTIEVLGFLNLCLS